MSGDDMEESRQLETPQGSESEQLPETITAGGRTRAVSRHAVRDAHTDITAEIIEFVLNNWVIRGICVDSQNRQGRVHWAFTTEHKEMIRVVVSMNDETIVTAYQDRTATRHWNAGSREYFESRCGNLEERDANSL